MIYSRRVLVGHTVGRETDGVLVVSVEDVSLILSPDDLKALMAFSETGAEPPETDNERKGREKGEAFAKFLDGLILPK